MDVILALHLDALLACEFFETVTLAWARMYVLAAIEHAHRRIHILGVTAGTVNRWVAGSSPAGSIGVQWLKMFF